MDCGAFEHGARVAVGAGVIYVSYRDEPAGEYGYGRLKMLRSDDDGATWRGPVTLANHTGHAWSTQITAENTEAYISYVTDDGRARYRRTTDRGETWTGPADLAPPCATPSRHRQAASGASVAKQVGKVYPAEARQVV